MKDIEKVKFQEKGERYTPLKDKWGNVLKRCGVCAKQGDLRLLGANWP